MSTGGKKVTVEEKLNESTDLVDQVVGLLDRFQLQDFLKLEEVLREKYGLADLGSISSGSGSQDQSEEDSSTGNSVSLFIEDLGSLTKIEAMKLLNQTLKLSVSEVKSVLESLPYQVLNGVTKEQAQEKVNEINASKEGLVFSVK